MTKTELLEFITERPRVGRLATTDAGGHPHVVPVWFKVNGEEILVHTMAAMAKARNVADTGVFALAVDTDVWPYRGVMIRGSARTASSQEIDHRFIEDLTVEYLGEGQRPMGRYMADLPGEHATLVLTPDSWHAWDYK